MKVKLRDVSNIIMGQSPDSSTYNTENIGLPFFQGNADFGELNPIAKTWCSAPIKIAYKNYILISVRAPIGALNIAVEPCCIGRGLAALDVNNKICTQKYLWYLLEAKKNELISKGTGSTFKAISKNILSEMEFNIPPVREQELCTKTLDVVFCLIRLKKEQLDKLDLLVKSRFIEMFGDPVLNNKGWPVKKLKQLTSKISSGNTPKGGREVYVSEGITFFRSQNVWRNYFDMSDIAYIDEATHKKMADTSLKHGDLLITKTGRFNTENSSLGRTALFLGENDSANINGHVYLVRLKAGINHQFVLHILISNQFRDLIRKVCVGGIDKRQLNKNHIEDFPIIIPPLEQQEEYADFVQQVDKSKFVVTAKFQ